ELDLLPPPLWGRAGEGGVRRDNGGATCEGNRATPTPNPSPQGGGERTERVSLTCRKHKRPYSNFRTCRGHAAPKNRPAAPAGRCRSGSRGAGCRNSAA